MKIKSNPPAFYQVDINWVNIWYLLSPEFRIQTCLHICPFPPKKAVKIYLHCPSWLLDCFCSIPSWWNFLHKTCIQKESKEDISYVSNGFLFSSPQFPRANSSLLHHLYLRTVSNSLSFLDLFLRQNWDREYTRALGFCWIVWLVYFVILFWFWVLFLFWMHLLHHSLFFITVFSLPNGFHF